MPTRTVTVHSCLLPGDFGLARIRSAQGSHSTASQVVGTLGWMAPELLLGGKRAAQATPQSDVYALGVVWWELLTGMEPYEGYSPGQIVLAIVGGEQPPIPEHLPAGAAQLLRACYTTNRLERPSCSDVIGALQQLQQGGTADASPAASSIASVSPSTSESDSGSGSSAANAIGHSVSPSPVFWPSSTSPTSGVDSVCSTANG